MMLTKRHRDSRKNNTYEHSKADFTENTTGAKQEGHCPRFGLSKNTLWRYIQLIQGSGYPPEQLIAMDDHKLEQILNQKTAVNRDHFNDIEELFPWIKEELRRRSLLTLPVKD